LNGDFSDGLNHWHRTVLSDPGVYLPENSEAFIRHNDGAEIVNTSEPWPDGVARQPILYQFMRFNAPGIPPEHRLRTPVTVDSFDWPAARKACLTLIVLPVGWSDLFEDAEDMKSSTLDKDHPIGELEDHSVTITQPADGNDKVIAAVLEGCYGVTRFH